MQQRAFGLHNSPQSIKKAHISSLLSTQCAELLKWYWDWGRMRAGEHDLSGSWVDQLYQVHEASLAVEAAKKAGKPCLALWGPSQSGKSTLLSHYLDSPNAPDYLSALQWTPQEPVIFVGRPDAPGACTHLNPFAERLDASGCVTRFVLCEAVADPDHPVALSLATEGQLLHALAVGYIMECDTRVEGREVFLDADQVGSKLAGWSGGGGGQNREVRESLQTVLSVIDDLIAGDWPRYSNLRSDWSSLRPRLAAHAALRGTPNVLWEFAAWLFWDSQPQLTDLGEGLFQQREAILRLAASGTVCCAYPVARFFLDIDAYRKLEAGHGLDEILGVRYGLAQGQACLDTRLTEPAFADKETFGRWQALVWEMVLPVNARSLPRDSAARRLLEVADLLDFPGVALA